jgi:hypothetical protein
MLASFIAHSAEGQNLAPAIRRARPWIPKIRRHRFRIWKPLVSIRWCACSAPVLPIRALRHLRCRNGLQPLRACRRPRSDIPRGSGGLRTSTPGSRACQLRSAPGRRARIRDVRRHAMVRHGSPGMVVGRRLREPHAAGVPSELAALERTGDRIAVTDLGARRIHEVGTPLHLGDERLIEQVLCLRAPLD